MKRQGEITFGGDLSARIIRGPGNPVNWRYHLRNRLKWRWIKNFLVHDYIASKFTELTGVVVLLGSLRATLIKADGRKYHYEKLAHGLVTTAFVNDLVDELQAAAEFHDYKYHDSGVGVTAANIADTDIETTDGETRATGTQTENAANIYESVGTINYSTTKAITEHGLFNNLTGATLMDRHDFAAMNVDNGDAIEFTYRLTVTAGG
jgi:hypothetical protein